MELTWTVHFVFLVLPGNTTSTAPKNVCDCVHARDFMYLITTVMIIIQFRYDKFIVVKLDTISLLFKVKTLRHTHWNEDLHIYDTITTSYLIYKMK